jgi:hypothetical protein
VFYYLTYQGAVDIDAIEDKQLQQAFLVSIYSAQIIIIETQLLNLT